VSEPKKFEINRTLVAVIAVVTLVGGGVSTAFDSSANALGPAMLRMGILMSALWLALPFRFSGSRAWRVSPWVLIVVLAVLLFVVRRPGAVVPAIILLFVTAILVRPWRTFDGAKKRNPPQE
jgi:hypothetical protein